MARFNITLLDCGEEVGRFFLLAKNKNDAIRQMCDMIVLSGVTTIDIEEEE